MPDNTLLSSTPEVPSNTESQIDVGRDVKGGLVAIGSTISAQTIHIMSHQYPPPFPPTTSDNVPPEQSADKKWLWKWMLRLASVFLLGVNTLVFLEQGINTATVGGFLIVVIALLITFEPTQAYIGDRRWGLFYRKNDRAEMLERLQKSWIEGALYTALRGVPGFKIGTVLKTDAVLHHKNLPKDYSIHDTGEIYTLYRVFDKRLLILGLPGSGKTILLLQLAEILLKEARMRASAQIPVVFNLASWAKEPKPLKEWLVDEFSTFYHVRRKVVLKWLENNDLVLLLDGLDEVKLEVREQCVEAINAFRQNFAICLVVCSRISDYEALSVKLNLEGAITLRPLEQAAVDSYLQSQSQLSGLITALKQDSILRAMSTTPFLLNTMIYTYANASPAEIGIYPDHFERHQRLFDSYIERRLRDNPSWYSFEATLKYLKWLAHKMFLYTQTVFLLQDIEPYWLDETMQERYLIVESIPAIAVSSFISMILSFWLLTWISPVIVAGVLSVPASLLPTSPPRR
jgi:hypothetical protein